MVVYFPKIYPEEILYSIVARYHLISVANSSRDTLEDLFGRRSITATLELPSHLEAFQRLVWEMDISKDKIINQHTLFPLYEPFLYSDEQIEIRKMMLDGRGGSIKSKIGFDAGSICKKASLFYCPICAECDFEIYGETYLRVVHQMQGVFVCPNHKVWLLEYPVRRMDVSRLYFIPLEKELLSFSAATTNNYNFMAISEMAAEIFKGELNGFCTEDLKERYLHRLNEMELVTVSPRVRQKQLAEMLLSFYGKTTLMKYESLIDESVTDHNWLATYFRRKKRKLHPIRHLLLIYMLFSSLEELKSINIPKEPEFFPCLNPVADHYKELIVQDVKWSMDSKTRKQVGTFRCHKCGFVYSRKIDTDPYRIGRIKEFGPIWYAKLKTLDRNLSLRAKARSMGCDPKTIVRYIDRN